MFREEIGSTFSDIWYRVADRRPRLSPHAQTIRQNFGPTVAYVVEDPASGQYYRLTESAYFFVGLLDGRRTVAEAWDACNAQLGDSAPTQRECIDLLGKLQLYGLLLGDLPLAADMVLERKQQVRSRRLLKRTGRGMFLSLPLFNPEPFLERIKHLIKPVFSGYGLAAWIIAFVIAVIAVAREWPRFGDQLDGAALLSPENLVYASLSFLVLRILHELGHASACNAMGGRSTEIGVIMIAWVLPIPYCDATSSWRFPEIRRRVLVSAAGMIVETFIASLAAIVWAFGEPGTLLSALCYNTVVISGVTTLLFNINPLLRYDGYYILSDLVGIPNMAQRSRELWKFLLERVAFGIKGLRPPPVRDPREAWFLGVYGLLSVPYRLFITVSIILIISSQYITLGAVLAVILVTVWLVWPILKGIGYLAASPRLMGRRLRAAAVVGSFIVVAGTLLGIVPVRAAGYAGGTIEPVAYAGLHAGETGFVSEARRTVGELVAAGDVVFVLENPQLVADARTARAQLAAAARVAHMEAADARARARLESLVVRSPIRGRIAATPEGTLDLRALEGRFAQRGALLALVLDEERLVVRASVSERDRAYIFPEGEVRPGQPAHAWPRATVRIRGSAGLPFGAAVIRAAPAGSRDINTPSLSTISGGNIAPDPGDPEGTRSLVSQFAIELEPVDLPESARPGARVRVRFGVPPRPLLTQWWRTWSQFLGPRLSP